MSKGQPNKPLGNSRLRVTLQPPEFVPLEPKHEAQMVDALAELYADYLDRHRDVDGEESRQ
jgi:hypothetical protein